MRTSTGRGARAMWVTIGVIVMAVGLWFIEGWERPHPSQRDEKRSSQDMQREPQVSDTEKVKPSTAPGGEPAQAYAMVSPFKQQLIGVKTAVVEKRPMETVVRAVVRVEYDEQRVAYVMLQ